MIFDTHAHYDDHQYDTDREAVIASLSAFNIGSVMNVAADMESVYTTLELAEKYDFIYAALGVHPDGIENLAEEDMETIRDLVLRDREKERPKVKAIGEIGLDYHGREIPRETQIKWFERQLQLAEELDLPVIIHSRDAAQDTYEILKSHKTYEGCGIIHCFSYSKEMARQFLDLGYYIALGGVVTFKNAKNAKEVASCVPADRLLLETDCPYMAPTPHRGERNDSGKLSYVAETIAEIRGITEEEVERMTWDNARRLYRIL